MEDMIFFIISKLPESLIPHFLMEWLDRYTTKRIAELKHQIIKDNWRTVALEKIVDDISKEQRNMKKAP